MKPETETNDAILQNFPANAQNSTTIPAAIDRYRTGQTIDNRWTSNQFVKRTSTCIYISYSSSYLDHFSHSICSLVLSLIILMSKRKKQVDH